MYSLNLKTNEWKKICKFADHGVMPRSDFSMNLYKNQLYIFGGKNNDVKYN